MRGGQGGGGARGLTPFSEEKWEMKEAKSLTGAQPCFQSPRFGEPIQPLLTRDSDIRRDSGGVGWGRANSTIFDPRELWREPSV